ncbi:MAG: hypothetical protein BWK77_06990 [Verrucomicrobia bacterium A1]|nr:MAG: hypothetical protein BWK77_06990 [Verrucomicrobia bacterium A1]
MSTVTFKGTPVRLAGELPAVGHAAPPFHLTAADLSEKGLDAFTGRIKIFEHRPESRHLGLRHVRAKVQ